jgi:hypothetical protein
VPKESGQFKRARSVPEPAPFETRTLAEIRDGPLASLAWDPLALDIRMTTSILNETVSERWTAPIGECARRME